MCGRFVLKITISAISKHFGTSERPNLRPRYNAAPTQTVPIVQREHEGDGREFALVRWGRIPAWAKDAKIGYKTINARAATDATAPSFRSAFRRRHCLIPADGFYQWKKVGGGKQPMLIQLKDGGLFAFEPVGLVARGRRRPGRELHDHHDGAQCGDRADPQPNAGDP